MYRLVDFASRLVNAAWFEYFIIAVIIVNGIILGLETSDARLTGCTATGLRLGNEVALWVFIVEAALKMLALWPRSWRYFRDGWNIFDFLVIVFALVPATGSVRDDRPFGPAAAGGAPDLGHTGPAADRGGAGPRHPSVGHVIMLMSIVVYIYAIMGFHLFHELDPARWGNLGLSVLTLFNIITLDGWTEVMNAAMLHYPFAWLYFVSFVVVGTFVVINLFIAIIINSLDDAKRERDRDRPPEIEGPVSREQMVQEIRAARATLERLERRLEAEEGGDGKPQ